MELSRPLRTWLTELDSRAAPNNKQYVRNIKETHVVLIAEYYYFNYRNIISNFYNGIINASQIYLK